MNLLSNKTEDGKSSSYAVTIPGVVFKGYYVSQKNPVLLIHNRPLEKSCRFHPSIALRPIINDLFVWGAIESTFIIAAILQPVSPHDNNSDC